MTTHHCPSCGAELGLEADCAEMERLIMRPTLNLSERKRAQLTRIIKAARSTLDAGEPAPDDGKE